jgi:hypothetical protein
MGFGSNMVRVVLHLVPWFFCWEVRLGGRPEIADVAQT